MADVGCARPTGASVNKNPSPAKTSEEPILDQQKEQKSMVQAKVGKAAPDFEAPAYQQGEFGSVKLSDYLGKWVLLCFYPGDFTFV